LVESHHEGLGGGSDAIVSWSSISWGGDYKQACFKALLEGSFVTKLPVAHLFLFWVGAILVGIDPTTSSGKHLLIMLVVLRVALLQAVIAGVRVTMSCTHFELPPGTVGSVLGLVA
jgi:hypothetical protein